MQVMLTICPVVLTQYIFTVNIAVVFKGLMLYFWIVDKWLDCSAPRREVQLPLHVTGDPGTLVCTPVWPCYIQVSEMILLSSEACTFWFSFLLKVFLLGFHLYIKKKMEFTVIETFCQEKYQLPVSVKYNWIEIDGHHMHIQKFCFEYLPLSTKSLL